MIICNYVKDIYENHIHHSLSNDEFIYSKPAYDMIYSAMNKCNVFEKLNSPPTVNIINMVELSYKVFYESDNMEIISLVDIGFDWHQKATKIYNHIIINEMMK
jgi:hypothetical protein